MPRRPCTWTPVVVLLMALLFAGHLCDVAAIAEAHGHHHDTAPHPSHHQDDHDSGGCDPVVAARPASCAHGDHSPIVDPGGALPVVGDDGAPHRVAAFGGPTEPPRRVPLFLLHASFLI